MKALKISMIVIVVIAIAFFAIRSLIEPKKVQEPPAPKNQFILSIEHEINSLVKLPDSTFCKDAYDNILFLIDENYKPHLPQYPYGRLGNSQSENDQQKENLTKRLYSAYAGKFIRQVFYVFRGSKWNVEDLKFIRAECQTLKNSPLLEKNNKSLVYNKFTEIQVILSKYDEITNFISESNGFSYTATDLPERFPIADVQNKITKVAKYQSNHLENDYVNNCERLHNGLKNIPQVLFQAHINYLDNKINHWANLYPNYKSQKEYSLLLNQPLDGEIEALDNDIYRVADFDIEKERLTKKWGDDNIKAFDYPYLKKVQ